MGVRHFAAWTFPAGREMVGARSDPGRFYEA